jgi:hypothetical protein
MDAAVLVKSTLAASILALTLKMSGSASGKVLVGVQCPWLDVVK